MSRADYERLLRDLQNDPALMQELKSRADDPGRSAEWVHSRGYDITPAELRELRESDRELSDDELEQAAGGDDGWGTGTTSGDGG